MSSKPTHLMAFSNSSRLHAHCIVKTKSVKYR
jgi:hypothetical protein